MKKHFVTGLFAVLAMTANAQSFKEWQDPEINAVNRAPMHTNYFAFENAINGSGYKGNQREIIQFHDLEWNLEI